MDISPLVGQLVQPGIKPILELVQSETVEVESPFERPPPYNFEACEIPIPYVDMHRDLV